MTHISEPSILERICRALEACQSELRNFSPGNVPAQYKSGQDPVTEADRDTDRLLREMLPVEGEGWLSEETIDDRSRLACERVWVVDPLDGTREFVAGIPEWCVSVAYVLNGIPIAGGICNPATGETFLGSLDTGVTRNGVPVRVSSKATLEGARVLASRSEVSRGEWESFSRDGFHIEAMGSVAYKLARVAAGFADATFTLVPKHEWDVAAGVALVQAAGGCAWTSGAGALTFNMPEPRFRSVFACGRPLRPHIEKVLLVRSAEELPRTIQQTVQPSFARGGSATD